MKRKLKITQLEERIVFDASAAAVVAEAASAAEAITGSAGHQGHGSHDGGAQIIYVDANNTSGSQDGSSWKTAFSSLQDALEAAEASAGADQIWMAEGRYSPTEIYSPDGVLGGAAGIVTDNLKTFNLPDEVSLYGGFEAGMKYFHQRDADRFLTILDGDLLGNDINDKSDPGYLASKADNSWHVLMATNDVAGTGVEAHVEGVTVMNGFAAGPATPPLTNNEGLRSPHDYGGGFLINWNSEVTVHDVIFQYNHANGDGGGMFYNNSDVVVSDSSFYNNDAGLRGGAIEAFATEDINTQPHQMLITGSEFIGNSAFVFGGAIVAEGSEASDDSKMVIEDSYFEANHALEGGAIVVDSLNTDVYRSHFHQNTADVNAGALATTNVVNQLVWGNDRFFTTRVFDSVFTENFARSDAATAAFMNSLFSDPPLAIEFPTGGGAVVNYMRGILEIDGSHFVGNSTQFGQGGAILNADSATTIDPGFVLAASSETIITDSFFAHNSAVDGGAIASNSLIGLVPDTDVHRSTIDISGSKFVWNTASNRGGSLYLSETSSANLYDNRFWVGNEAGVAADQIYAADSVVNGYATSDAASEADVILNNRFHLLDGDDLEFI